MSMRLFPRDRDLSQPLERIELRVRASDFGLPVDHTIPKHLWMRRQELAILRHEP